MDWEVFFKWIVFVVMVTALCWPQKLIPAWLMMIVTLLFVSVILYSEVFNSGRIPYMDEKLSTGQKIGLSLAVGTIAMIITLCCTVGCFILVGPPTGHVVILLSAFLQALYVGYMTFITLWWIAGSELKSQLWQTHWYLVFSWCVVVVIRTSFVSYYQTNDEHS